MNFETDIPGFAVCRHPNQILNQFDKAGNSFEDVYNQSLPDIRYLSFYKMLEAQNVTRWKINGSIRIGSLALSRLG